MILGRTAVAILLGLLVRLPIASAQVLTSQNDNLRTSATLSEKQLRPSNVSAGSFGKLYSRTVDGDILSQPLYVPSITLPGIGERRVIFVATEHDSVYAFDSDGASDTPLWKVSFLDSAKGVDTVSPRDVHCPFIQPEIGITSTPVIDLSSGTLYVLARTKENGTFVQKLHALDISSGAEKLNGPVTIQATVSGMGTGAVNGKISFDPLRENPRAALLLAGGQVYITWGSSCDVGPYHGWVMAYDAHTLAQTAALNLTPNGGEGGIWQSDAGPAADTEGNVFAVTGNGDFGGRGNGAAQNYGDSIVKLRLVGNSLSVVDFFTPFNERELNAKDWDLGSQGPILLPDQRGAHPHLLIAAGKEGKLYLVDRDKMGTHQTASDNQVVQSVKLPAAYGATAYWNGHVFYTDDSYVTRDLALKDGHLTQRAVTAPMLAPAATPSVSANGSTNAIVWVLSTKQWNESSIDKPAVLHAYDAANIAHELYNSEQHSDRDRAGMTVRFAVPTIADGRVFVGTRRRLDVYGLIDARPANPNESSKSLNKR